jgi:hypothetical protein
MASNPFSSRYLEPGAIPFQFPAGHSLETLARRLERGIVGRSFRAPMRFAIVGPHGSGKSTLMRHLGQRLDCSVVVLHSSTAKWGAVAEAVKSVAEGRVCLVDGYEQLPVWGRALLVARSALYGVTLCVTSHRLPKFFELFWQTRVDTTVEAYVIDQLLSGESPRLKASLLESEAWRMSRSKRGGNLRESLFDMYDWWRDTVDEDPGCR